MIETINLPELGSPDTGDVLKQMLTENTGRAMLESGDFYGRNWQQNQGHDFDTDPETKLTFHSDWMEQEKTMQIEYEFYRQTGSVWEPTDLRPSADTMQHLEAEAQRKMAEVALHEPGMGWHFLPGPVTITFNGTYWYDAPQTSEGPILAHCDDLCRLKGLDLVVLYAQAYPTEEPLVVTAEDHAQCARPATLADQEMVLEDLTDVNYHSLRGVLEDAFAGQEEA